MSFFSKNNGSDFLKKSSKNNSFSKKVHNQMVPGCIVSKNKKQFF